jgi:V-type H+-transporting ATPase subunit a
LISETQEGLKNWYSSLNYANAENPKPDEIANLEAYKWLLAKEKAILTAINMMRPRNNNYIGFLWSPSVDEDDIQDKLTGYVGATFEKFKAGEGINELNPPTYIKTNELTWFFQTIVNTYGIPNY